MSIKINRAWKKSGIGGVPSMMAEIEQAIPLAVTQKLSSGELAELYVALNRHWHKAQAVIINDNDRLHH